jgi:exopolyphosphatase/guanosine-5'-triphosphate,3'-diphosphate pyrophosphatase
VTDRAAIDLGSNAARLLVRRDGQAPLRRSYLTHLSADLARTGRLGPDALERTATVLRGYRALIDDQGVPLMATVATAAARDAADADALSRLVTEILGGPLRVLTPDEEARLTFAGVRAAGVAPGSRLVVDIGGGSTEVVVGDAEPAGASSLEIGSASLTQAQLPSDPPRPEELSNAIAIVQEHVDDALRSLPDLDDGLPVVGTGGTVTTVAAVEIGLPVRPGDGTEDLVDEALHGFWLSRAAAEDVFRTLAGEAVRDRIHNPGLPRQRAGIIVGGCCILVGLLRRLGAPGLRVSLADLLDGLLEPVD